MIDQNMDDDEPEIIGQMVAIVYDSEERCEVSVSYDQNYPSMLHPKTILTVVLTLIDVAGDKAARCDCPACRRMKRFCTTTAPRLVNVLDTAKISTCDNTKDAIGACEGSA